MYGYALTLAGLEGAALTIVLGLAIACALVATLLLVGQIAATARSRAPDRIVPGSSLPTFLISLGCILGSLALLQMLAGSGVAEAARAALGMSRP